MVFRPPAASFGQLVTDAGRKRSGTVSYAQTGEDLQIALLLGRRDDVTYIDVGCLFPVEQSSTYFFYERGGWGLCVDPYAPAREAFERDRPRDVFFHGAAGRERGRATYFEHENPVFNTMSPQRAALVERQASTRPGRALTASTEVDVLPLAEIVLRDGFAERCGGRVDVLSIDVEGLEEEVVAGHDFSLVRPRLVVCEHLRRSPSDPLPDSTPLGRRLAGEGYWLAAWTGHDAFFLDGS
jgi:Methyltransferase FkbM domain